MVVLIVERTKEGTVNQKERGIDRVGLRWLVCVGVGGTDGWFCKSIDRSGCRKNGGRCESRANNKLMPHVMQVRGCWRVSDYKASVQS